MYKHNRFRHCSPQEFFNIHFAFYLEYVTFFQTIGVGEILDDINDLWLPVYVKSKTSFKRGKTYASPLF